MIGIHPLFRGSGGFLGKANKDGFVEVGVMCLSVLVPVDGFECFPEDLGGKVARRSPCSVRDAIRARGGVVGNPDSSCRSLLRGIQSSGLALQGGWLS